MKILLERFPYRYVEMGTLDNGFPDYRIQKADHYTKRYSDMYLCDMVCNLPLLWRTLNIQKWLIQIEFLAMSGTMFLNN